MEGYFEGKRKEFGWVFGKKQRGNLDWNLKGNREGIWRGIWKEIGRELGKVFGRR